MLKNVTKIVKTLQKGLEAVLQALDQRSYQRIEHDQDQQQAQDNQHNDRRILGQELQ